MSNATTQQDSNKIDSYILTNCLFTGKFSQVWEVMEEGTPLQFAMKLLLPEFTREREQVQSLKWEAKIGMQLQHPNLLTYHKVVCTRQHAYLLMDLFRSMSVKSWLSGDLLSLQLHFRRLVESLCLVLGYLHEKGWIHKDVKPDNILLNKAGEVRLIDFSLTVKAPGFLGRVFRLKKPPIQGTRTYIAPETIKREPPSPQTDMYSLGVTLFEVLTGNPPFTGTSPNELLRHHLAQKPPAPSSLNPNVTPEMDRLILRMLAKKPKDRPSSMQEIYGEFRSIKPFKEEIEALIEERTKKTAADKAREAGLDARLDSRLDAATGSPSGAALLQKQQQPAQPKPQQQQQPTRAPQAAVPPQQQPQPQTPTAQPAQPVAPQQQPSQPSPVQQSPVQGRPVQQPAAPLQQPQPTAQPAPQVQPQQPTTTAGPTGPAAVPPQQAPSQQPHPAQQQPVTQPQPRPATTQQPSQPQPRPTSQPVQQPPAQQPPPSQQQPTSPPQTQQPPQQDDDLPPLPDELPPVL